MLAVALLVVGLTACGGGIEKHPFEAISEYLEEFLEASFNDPQKVGDEDYANSVMAKLNSLAENLHGKSIAVEVEEGIGYESATGGAEIGAGRYHGDNLGFNINVDLKVVNEEIAESNASNLIAVLYDDDEKAVFIQTFLEHELPLTIEETRSTFTDSIEVVDSISEVMEDDAEPIEEAPKADNPFAVGKTITKGISVSIETPEILLISRATKLKIMKYDSDRNREIRQSIKERMDKIMEELKEKAMAAKEKLLGNDDAGSFTPDASGAAFVLDGSLGPVKVGNPIANLPQSIDGLYDKYTYKKEVHEDDMDGPWTEEYYLFTKGGKEIFRANIFEGKVHSIKLLEGSSFVKTPDGIYVGYSARELFNKIRMQWTTYYDGNCFGTQKHFNYYVNSDDLIRTDIPHKAEDFTEDAKVIGIDYVN